LTISLKDSEVWGLTLIFVHYLMGVTFEPFLQSTSDHLVLVLFTHANKVLSKEQVCL